MDFMTAVKKVEIRNLEFGGKEWLMTFMTVDVQVVVSNKKPVGKE